MKKKLTIEYIRKQFKKENYKLLTTEYKSNKQKLNYICPNGHKHSITWNKWQRGRRCPYCYGNVKLTIEFIRYEFTKEGYKFLTKEYVNNKQELDYVCPKGHKHSTSWASWSKGHKCPYCYGNGKPTIEFIKTSFEKEKYILLTNEYKNCDQKLDYICPKRHKHSISWSNWQKGHRCPYCAAVSKPTIEFINLEFKKEKYKLLTEEYINSRQKLNYICPKGHRHSISWNRWQQGDRCPYCFGNISKGEIEVKNFIESLGIEVSPNDRSLIFNPETGNGLELDIFMPALNKAIEYNGEYWHQDKTRDLLKQQLCKSKNINLLIIWDKKWRTQNSVCKNEVQKFLFNVSDV